MTLLRDIQNSAIDSENKLSDLLRNCKVLANRLQHNELIQWVEFELNGYPSQDDLPTYRVVNCQAKGHFGGAFGAELKNMPIPAGCLPEKCQDWAKACHLIQPVSALEELSKGEGDLLQCDWPAEIIASTSPVYQGYNLYGAWLIISKSAIVAILDTVRNRILSFALEIEKENPDAGEALPNTAPISEEKVTQVFNTYITGNVQNIATGSTNFTQSGHFTVQKGDFESLSSFLKSNGVPEDDINELSVAIKEDDEHGQTQGFGKKVSTWVGNMLSKAGTTAWKIGTSSAGTLLTKALTKYYGLDE